MRSLIPFLACALILPAAAASGDIIHVPVDQPTIEAGLGAASIGDTVMLESDVYYESGLVLPSGVTLMSEYYNPDVVVIDGSRRGVILTCSGVTDAAVLGISFRGGSGSTGGAIFCDNASVLIDTCRFYGNTASISGACIYWGGGTPEITRCRFNDNISDGVGGGIAMYATDGSVTGCLFSDNTAQWGGGVFASTLNMTTVFTDCGFRYNNATNSGIGGGGVYCNTGAAPTFVRCRFEHNDGAYGGAAYSNAESAPTFVDCEFSENTSTYHAGAFHGYNDETDFDGCEFTFNVAGGGGGGAMLLNRSNSVITGCTFYKNEAAWGGAVVASGDATLDITSSTFAENTVPRNAGGAGLYIYDGAAATVGRCIIAFNRGGEAVKCDGGSAALTCSDVSGNDGGDWVDCIAGQESSDGNLYVNPFFCDLAGFDLTLCADSECLAQFNDCGELIGAWSEGCPECSQPVESVSWGVIKGVYR